MEEKKPISHLLAGTLIALAIILYSLVMTLAGNSSGAQGGFITYLIIIIGLILFIYRHGKAHNNQLSFGELFSYGFKATTMVVLIFVVFLLILSFAIPEIKQKVLEATRLEMEKQKSLTEADVETMMQNADRYFLIILIGTTMFFFVLFGAIGSLIGAAITKKEPKDPFDQINS